MERKLFLFPDTEISTPVFTGLPDYEVQIRYKSELNKTKYIQTNKLSISFLDAAFWASKVFERALNQWLMQNYKIYLII